MSRTSVRAGRALHEIGDAIVAAWYKVLPDDSTGMIGIIDKDELTAVFSEILSDPCTAVVDPINPSPANPLSIVVPQPPVKTRQELIDYILDFHNRVGNDYHDAMGNALLFGCGR